MRRAVVLVLVLVGVLSLGACGGDEDDAADTSVASTTAPRGEPIVIRMRKLVALTSARSRSPPARSSRGPPSGTRVSAPAGPSLDSHGSSDPTVLLIIETFTCPDGTVNLRLEPDPSPGLNQTGSWTTPAAPVPSSGCAGAARWRPCTTLIPPSRLT